MNIARLRRGTAALVLLLPLAAATAGVVDYTATSLGGSLWRYDYTINNTTPSTPFDELTIFFDVNVYQLLSSPSAPAGWDPLLIQPDPGIPADGFFDAIHLAGPLPDGATISGFSVTFSYVGQGTPGAQPFELLDSATFTTVLEGRTSPNNPGGDIPEPAALALSLTALLAAGGARFARNRPAVLRAR